MRTLSSSVALSWGAAAAVEDYDLPEDRTQTRGDERPSATLPPSMILVARDLLEIAGNSTGGDRLSLASYSGAAVYIGRALVMKPSKKLRRYLSKHSETTEPQPHMAALAWIREETGLSQQRVAQLVGVSRQTLHLWARGEVITDANRRRIFAVRDVLQRAKKRYKTRVTLVEWLDSPVGREGRTPAELIAAGDIDRARLLAVSTPSSRVAAPLAAASQPTSERSHALREHQYDAMPPDQDEELLAQFGEPGADEDD